MKKNCLIVFAVLLGLFLSMAIFSAPPEIAPGSSISDAQVWSPDKTEQSWPGSASADSYMLYRGSRAELPNLLTGDSDSCARYSGTDTFVDLSEDDPSSMEGRFFWYIVTGYDAYGEGPAGDATACSRVLDPGSSCGSSYCGDGYCDGNEGAWCPDCPPFCGDGICDPSEECMGCSDCPPCCGDLICDPSEECAGCTDCPPCCGDGYCDSSEECTGCSDCPPCCGDLICDPSEVGNCSDCGPYCGDGNCDPGEEGNCSDCGPYCGDGNCDPGEEGWCSDCPGSCGDTICDPGEEGWCPDCP